MMNKIKIEVVKDVKRLDVNSHIWQDGAIIKYKNPETGEKNRLFVHIDYDEEEKKLYKFILKVFSVYEIENFLYRDFCVDEMCDKEYRYFHNIESEFVEIA